MLVYFITCESSYEFATNLLRGVYDLPIFSHLRDLSRTKDHRSFKSMDPTDHFIFEVELTDEDYFFDIGSRNMNYSLEWDPNISEMDRKSIMLLASIIRRTHGEIQKSSNMRKRLSRTSSRLRHKRAYQEAIIQIFQTHQPGQPLQAFQIPNKNERSNQDEQCILFRQNHKDAGDPADQWRKGLLQVFPCS